MAWYAAPHVCALECFYSFSHVLLTLSLRENCVRWCGLIGVYQLIDYYLLFFSLSIAIDVPLLLWVVYQTCLHFSLFAAFSPAHWSSPESKRTILPFGREWGIAPAAVFCDYNLCIGSHVVCVDLVQQSQEFYHMNLFSIFLFLQIASDSWTTPNEHTDNLDTKKNTRNGAILR